MYIIWLMASAPASFSRTWRAMLFVVSTMLFSFFSRMGASSLGMKDLKERLDINQKVYIDGQPVLGDGTGVGSLNQCKAFADHFVSDPRKPDVKVCGTGVKMTVYLLGRCGQKSTGKALSTSGMAHTWSVGACDKGLDAKTCKEFGPGVDQRFGASQSYKIEQC